MPDLSIIIVSYNVRHFLEHCLSSMYQAVQGLEYEIFVVDNCSHDSTETLFAQPRPGLTFIRNQENLGFACANNQALRLSRGRYVLLLNPDTVVQEDTFRAMVGFMDQHPDAGIAGCKILNPDGTLQLGCRRSFPTPLSSFFRLSGLSLLFPRSRRVSTYHLTYLDPDQVTEVDAVSGSFLLARRAMLDQAGLLDEQFFMYGEDLDWCWRAKAKGWKVYYTPATQIIHFKGESSRGQGFRHVQSFYRAMHLFVRKHYRYAWAWRVLLAVAIYLRAGLESAVRGVVRTAVPALDVVLMNVAVVAAYYIRFLQHGLEWPYGVPGVSIIIHLAVTAVWLASFAAAYTYRGAYRYYLRPLWGTLLGFLALTSLTFFFKDYGYSRLAALYAWLIGSGLVVGWRLAARIPLFKRQQPKRTFIIGGGEGGAKVFQQVARYALAEYAIVGVIDDNAALVTTRVGNVRVVGTLAQLAALVREFDVEELLVAPLSISYEKLLALVQLSRRERVRIKLVSESYDTIVSKLKIEKLEELPLSDLGQ
jgi:GT2 family glycosyltransferase